MPYDITLSDEIVFLQNSQCLRSTWTAVCWWNLTAFTLLFASLLPKWLYLKPQGGLPHTPLPFWFSPIFHCGGISKWLAVALQQWQIGELQINLVTKTALFFVTSDLYSTNMLSTLKGVHFLKGTPFIVNWAALRLHQFIFLLWRFTLVDIYITHAFRIQLPNKRSHDFEQ